MKIILHLTLLRVLSSLSLWLIPAVLGAREPQIEAEQILQTTGSWDGQTYQGYPTGQPQLTVLRITIPPAAKSLRVRLAFLVCAEARAYWSFVPFTVIREWAKDACSTATQNLAGDLRWVRSRTFEAKSLNLKGM